MCAAAGLGQPALPREWPDELRLCTRWFHSVPVTYDPASPQLSHLQMLALGLKPSRGACVGSAHESYRGAGFGSPQAKSE